jgi:hypothetical protein
MLSGPAGSIRWSLPEPDAVTALASVLGHLEHSTSSRKLLRRRARIVNIDRPQLLSVPEVAAVLQASEAYVRRLLIGKRLYGMKVGPVWAVYPEDLETFQRLRRPPGRPRGTTVRPAGESDRRLRINSERASAGTGTALRKAVRSRRKSEPQA